jgi:hypothetical protein
MTKRLETKRFHVDTGPAELFERVLQIFEEPRPVKLHAGHFRQRAAERTAPKWALDPFDGADWSIVTAEVRTDSGKFVHTQWRRVIDGVAWWVVLGFNDTAQTMYSSSLAKNAMNNDIVRSGPLWTRVQEVNRALVEAHLAK